MDDVAVDPVPPFGIVGVRLPVVPPPRLGEAQLSAHLQLPDLTVLDLLR
jgi:hypothetical protein